MVDRARVETFDESGRISEKDLAGHLDNTRSAGDMAIEASRGLLSRNNQLYEALTLLKGINVLGLRDTKTANTEPLASTAP